MQSVHLKTATLPETRAGAEFSSFPNLSNVLRIPPNMATPSRNTLPLKAGLENYSASVVPFSNGRLRANLPVAPADRNWPLARHPTNRMKMQVLDVQAARRFRDTRRLGITTRRIL